MITIIYVLCQILQEITDLRHSQSKIKKMLSETNTEIGHAVRRAEQYETEVKRLRSRVEELKKELAIAEDQTDTTCNQMRRLQRTNEELNGHVEGLQEKLHQLSARYFRLFSIQLLFFLQINKQKTNIILIQWMLLFNI